MTLTDRSRALIEKIDAASKLPLMLRAAQAERLVREASLLLLELSVESERLNRDASDLRARVDRMERDAVVPVMERGPVVRF